MSALTRSVLHLLSAAAFCCGSAALAMPKAAEHEDAPVTTGADAARPKRAATTVKPAPSAGKSAHAGKTKSAHQAKPAGKAKSTSKAKPAGKAKSTSKAKPAGKAKPASQAAKPAARSKGARASK